MKTVRMMIRESQERHLRPATELSSLAHRFASRMTLTSHGLSADCRSLLSLLLLEAGKGQPMQVDIEGPDEDQAYAELCGLLDSPDGAWLNRVE